MSSTGTYAASGAVSASARTNLLVAAALLLLFVVSAIVGAERKDITRGFDEVAQTSYVAHIQHTGNFWPALQDMRLLDPRSFRFTDALNYMNHPPLFYGLLAVFGPSLEGHPQALIVHRLIDVGLAAIGFGALLALGLAAGFPRYEFYAYAMPMACIPVLVPLAGAINNDDLAFLGSAVALLAAWQLVATGRQVWLAAALAGVVVAGWSKLTGLVLTGGMVGAVICYLLWRKRLSWSWTIMAAVGFAFALAAAPYVVYIAQYGGPAPNTAAQVAFVDVGARAFGWADLPRFSFPRYFAYFVCEFIANWMPTLATRSAFEYALLAIPVTALGSAAAGVALSLRRAWRRRETTLDVIVICGALAIAANFSLHITYSYSFYAATGWLAGAYPRYYLPLAAIVPLAGLSLVAAIESPRWRGALLGFLIAGPIMFRIFGAPLG